jgi:TolA-binding protein
MNTKVKLAAYAILLLLAAGFGWGFHANYSTVTRESAATATNDTAPAATSNPAGTTNTADTSNAAAATTNKEVTALAPPARTNAATAVTTPATPSAHPNQGTMIAYLAAFVGALIGLGLLIAHDVTQFFGNVAVDALLDVGGEGARDPEYEAAEEAWAKGRHLDAIEMLREFLKRNPRAQYAALRIAEIYEKDLNNVLAAVLEYEEVLKKKLPAERWGWAAVHLCNLYSKLGQQDKSMALLRRIADEYPKTAAAKKARSRLGLAEPESEPDAKDGTNGADTASGDTPTPPSQPAAEPSATPAPPAPPPKSNLPPGFRPK